MLACDSGSFPGKPGHAFAPQVFCQCWHQANALILCAAFLQPVSILFLCVHNSCAFPELLSCFLRACKRFLPWRCSVGVGSCQTWSPAGWPCRCRAARGGVEALAGVCIPLTVSVSVFAAEQSPRCCIAVYSA
eukprot:1132744-Pelagomonas_calceolata.AAC.5